ncbi:MAG TPA: hypothetical protein VGN97_04310 [Mesorhizobium sp.]|jgi:hypothetical protein|nr:hypothetical protein [Mesorhizobium sp.]
MTNIIKKTALAGLVALSAMAAAPAAHADGLYFQFGLSGGDVVYKERDYDRHGRDYGRRGRVCTPERALDKAERLGFRRVELERVNRNRIVVSGRKHGEWSDIVFSRDGRNCPVIRIR